MHDVVHCGEPLRPRIVSVDYTLAMTTSHEAHAADEAKKRPVACAVLIQKRRPSRLQKRIVATSPNAIFLAQD